MGKYTKIKADGGPIKGKKKPAIKVSDPTNLNLHAYLDSSNLHNAYLEQLKYNPPQDVNKSYAAGLSIAKDYINSDKDFKSKSKAGRTQYFKPSSTQDKWTSEAAFKRDVPEDAPLIDKYKNLTFSTPTETGLWTTPDLYNQNIAPIGIYYGGKNADDGAWNPIWAAPTQPYEYTGDINDVLQYRSKPTIHGAGVKFSPKTVLNAAPVKQKGLNIPSIQYNPKDTNPYNKYVVNRYLPTPQSPVNPIPYDDIQLYSGHQNLANAGKPIGYYMNEGKRFEVGADEYNAIMGSSVQGGTKLESTNYAMGGRMNQAQQLNAAKMRVGNNAPDGTVWKDIGAGAYGVLEGTLDTVSMGMTDKLTDAGYKGLQKIGGGGNTREQDMIRGFGNIGGAVVGAVVNPASTMTAVNQGIKGLGQGVGNINENTQGIGNAISGLSGLTGLMPSGEGMEKLSAMGAQRSFKQGGLMHINEGGTHEQNALGGVPIGPNALVEQGETINNDFVFSDRLKPKGSKKTYAQLSKSVDTKYKLRPDDKLSKEAKQMDLDRLAMQQEAQKDEMSTKYMQKAMACGGKIKGFGGSFQGPISQSMNVTNGQNTLLANGGLMSNFMEKPTVYQNPANLSNQYAMGGYADQEYDPNPLIMAEGGIHIKPENRGKFTAYKERTGKTTEEALHSPNAHVRQMANFARNASKWKHAMGGNMYDDGGPMLAPVNSPFRINPYTMQNYNQRYLSNLDNIPTSILENRGFEAQPQPISNQFEGPNIGETYFDESNVPAMQQPNDYSNAFERLEFDPSGRSRLNPMDSRVDNVGMGSNTNLDYNNYQPQTKQQIAQFNNIPLNAEARLMGQKQGNALDKYAGNNQNPYPEVGNTGYLTNLAGNLIKAGMVATSKEPIYNPAVKFDRMNANPAERLAMQEGRREIQGTKDIIRNNATSSGQYLTNASLMGSNAANKLAGTIGGIRQGYDQQNVGIGNQEAQLNQQITSGNNLAKEQFRDNRLNQYNKILDSVIGANQQRFATDVHANNFQNQVISLLKTGVYHYGKQDEKGLWEILGPNGEVITKMPKV